MTDKEILEAFIEEMNKRGWTVDDAADALNVSRSTFFNWKNGKPISKNGRKALLLYVSSDTTSSSYIERAKNAIMSSDLPAEYKVKVWEILEGLKEE